MIFKFQNLTAIKKLPALQAVHAYAEGSTIKEVQNLEADLYVIYDEDDPRSDKISFKTTTTFTTITNVYVRYGELFDVELADTNTEPPSKDQSTTENTADEEDDGPPLNGTAPPNPPNGVYPGFRSIAIICAIIFFSVVLIAAADVSRKLIANRRRKRTCYEVEEIERLNREKEGKEGK